MNIIIEGHDNAGKSTLAGEVARALGRKVISSEGPEKYPGELIERVRRYSIEQEVVFDRHPCVSDLIYSEGRGRPSPLTRELADLHLYSKKVLIIYCDPRDRGLSRHIAKDHDTQEHLAMVSEKYQIILNAYREWAIDKAHVVYRIGDDVSRIIRICEDFDPLRDIQAFHDKFQRSYYGDPRALPDDVQEFRNKFSKEEHHEYLEAVTDLIGWLTTGSDANISATLARVLDALIDKVYVDWGTALLHGFTPRIMREAWRRVHAANMRKIAAVRAEDSTRGSALDVVKPEGWVAPDLTDLVKDHAHRTTR